MKDVGSLIVENEESVAKKFLSVVFLGLIFIYLVVSNYIVGKNDYLFLGLWLFNIYIIFSKFYSIRKDLRSMVKVNFSEDTSIYQFFNNKSTLQLILTVFISTVIALGFLVTLSSLIAKHGLSVTLVALMIPSLLLQITNSKFTFSIEKQLKDERGKQAVANLLELWIKGFILTVIIAVIFSFLDTFSFYSNEINFIDFSEVAEKNALPWSKYGKYSRLPINLIIVQDSFSSAIINQILITMNFDKLNVSPFWFWIITFVFSLFKFLPFSVAYLATILTIQDKAVNNTYHLLNSFLKLSVFKKLNFGKNNDK